MKSFILIFFFLSCASSKVAELSQKERIKIQIKYIKTLRPILKSDEFAFMKCTELGRTNVDKPKDFDVDTWKGFGIIELREAGHKAGANILATNHLEVGSKNRFNGIYYRCENTNTINEVDGPIGMCGASEERIFSLKYPNDDTREFGKEMLKQKIKYHGLSNHYISFSVVDMKYSFTRKEFQAKGYFFKCL